MKLTRSLAADTSVTTWPIPARAFFIKFQGRTRAGGQERDRGSAQLRVWQQMARESALPYVTIDA